MYSSLCQYFSLNSCNKFNKYVIFCLSRRSTAIGLSERTKKQPAQQTVSYKAASQNRTGDLRLTKATLYRLSHGSFSERTMAVYHTLL